MIFSPTRVAGATLIDIEPLIDERGFFSRTWCRRELTAQGLEAEIAQESVSRNRHKGTLRGLHFQKPPHEETKVVRCVRGAIFDIIVDIRPTSPSFMQWQGFELTAESHRALYVPKGCLHGFQTLEDDTEIFYLISNYYVPGAAAGYRYNDPAFSITLPLPVDIISERDSLWPDFSPGALAASTP